MTEVDPNAGEAAVQRAFARKIRLSAWALFFERLWPRLWLLIALAALFACVSFLGLWADLTPLAHQAIVLLFALAAAAAVIYAARATWPTRDEAIRRIERHSGVPHRPASSYEDSLTAQSANAETLRLWQAHRERLKRLIERLRVGRPSPRADRRDPLALRVLAMLVLLPAALLATDSWSERLRAAFHFGRAEAGLGQRLDAWVSPPPYTAVPPILLKDGGDQAARNTETPANLFEVPEGSLLTLRGTGFSATGLWLEVLGDGATAAEKMTPEVPKQSAAAPSLIEVRYTLAKSARIRAMSQAGELQHWTFSIIPDQLPKITLDTKRLDATPRGSMRLTYTAEDDYGVASAEAKVRHIGQRQVPDRNAWAKAPLEGPRLPLEPPPLLPLKIPRPGAKTLESSTLLDLGAHPWAGQRVELWLEATDVGGRTGRSAPVEIVLPVRQFKKPLARALIEMRRLLSEDSRNRAWVTRALTTLTMEPEGFIPSIGVYLGMRSTNSRLERSGSRAAISESIGELWTLALAVEDGKLSEAEQALKDAQDRLADALQRDAADEEIDRLLAELKQKLTDYLEAMRQQADNAGDDRNAGQQQENQQLGNQDLEEMMQNLERSAKQGSREEAEQMLSQLRELMDRLQSETKESREANQRAKEMMNKLNRLDQLADRQRQLMDDTFNAERNQQGDEQGAMEGGSQPGEQSENAERGSNDGARQQDNDGLSPNQGGGQMGQGQQGQGKQGKRGRNAGDRGMGEDDLRERQAELKRKLNDLKKELENMGAGEPEKLGKAEDAMGDAKSAIENRDFMGAAEKQGEALEQMRQAGKQMAEQMQKNAQQRMGRNGDTPRDPLGRPQRAQGPDLGTSVKVPDAIDAQRAREILEELRKRSGESLRPPVELDYIDRLLQRF